VGGCFSGVFLGAKGGAGRGGNHAPGRFSYCRSLGGGTPPPKLAPKFFWRGNAISNHLLPQKKRPLFNRNQGSRYQISIGGTEFVGGRGWESVPKKKKRGGLTIVSAPKRTTNPHSISPKNKQNKKRAGSARGVKKKHGRRGQKGRGGGGGRFAPRGGGDRAMWPSTPGRPGGGGGALLIGTGKPKPSKTKKKPGG